MRMRAPRTGSPCSSRTTPLITFASAPGERGAGAETGEVGEVAAGRAEVGEVPAGWAEVGEVASGAVTTEEAGGAGGSPPEPTTLPGDSFGEAFSSPKRQPLVSSEARRRVDVRRTDFIKSGTPITQTAPVYEKCIGDESRALRKKASGNYAEMLVENSR